MQHDSAVSKLCWDYKAINEGKVDNYKTDRQANIAGVIKAKENFDI